MRRRDLREAALPPLVSDSGRPSSATCCQHSFCETVPTNVHCLVWRSPCPIASGRSPASHFLVPPARHYIRLCPARFRLPDTPAPQPNHLFCRYFCGPACSLLHLLRVDSNACDNGWQPDEVAPGSSKIPSRPLSVFLRRRRLPPRLRTPPARSIGTIPSCFLYLLGSLAGSWCQLSLTLYTKVILSTQLSKPPPLLFSPSHSTRVPPSMSLAPVHGHFLVHELSVFLYLSGSSS